MSFDNLLQEIHQCTLCLSELEHGVRPVVQIHPNARLLIAGQAPGRKVHDSGVPFDDASGERLRKWLGIDREVFYDPQQVAILPMGFCYPGTGKSGDLPPRPECAIKWRTRVLESLPQIELTIVIGQYAQDYHLPIKYKTLTETVLHWREYLPRLLPIPHPSPRNNIWLRKNAWFEEDVIPELQQQVRVILEKN